MEIPYLRRSLSPLFQYQASDDEIPPDSYVRYGNEIHPYSEGEVSSILGTFVSFFLLTPLDDRRRIALLLASAVLQLHGTAWLGKSWTLDDVFVMDNCELYVSGSLKDQSSNTDLAEPTKTNDILRNETLFALGEALIELTYYSPLSSQDKITRYNVAIEMAKKLQQDELGNFASAVANCLVPSSPSRLDFDLEEDSFLEWYYHNVVLPLKEDYEVFLPESPAVPPPRLRGAAAASSQPLQPSPHAIMSPHKEDTQVLSASQRSSLTGDTLNVSRPRSKSRQLFQEMKKAIAFSRTADS